MCLGVRIDERLFVYISVIIYFFFEFFTLFDKNVLVTFVSVAGFLWIFLRVSVAAAEDLGSSAKKHKKSR